ncbi:MAG TPA: patatin-like phospholipase family protein [Vitreimonas sp.]|nr:patatin-like phospholipase family protein [Vitreimonas sp.]
MRIFIAALSLALCACATAPLTPVNSAPLAANPSPAIEVGADGDGVFVTLSGGGARAAAFGLGALQALRETRDADGQPLTDHIALLSSVSGGSILAAYYGIHGPEGLDTFRSAYLDKTWALHVSAAWPLNWLRAWNGGLNGDDRLAAWLDREIFAGAHMDALWRAGAPQVWLNAADLHNGTVFAFAPVYFDGLCSDLSRVRVADAVAASMAVPIVFEPILLQPQHAACAPLPSWVAGAQAPGASALEHAAARAFASYRDANALSYVHLVDGGVIDNLGLSNLALARETAGNAYAPFSPAAAVRLRRLSILVVNAEPVRHETYQMRPDTPSGPQVADTLYGVIIEAANRMTYDNFRAVAAQWQRDLVAYRCGLARADVARITGGAPWNCADVSIRVDMVSFEDVDAARRDAVDNLPTRVSLPRADIDALIAAGHDATAANALVQALTQPAIARPSPTP